ncbi:MAG: heavy-metal-associated domain-containing protein [Proteobacteria bacterium]|nr:heavy-metal-associated domain-containing protein [Pseudomonadota bacterium]
MSGTTIDIRGMTCQHCVKAVTRALSAVPGVTAAVVTLDPGQATVEGTASPDALIQAVVQEGYEARLP